MKTPFKILCLAIVSVTFGESTAADWPQWRGPKRDGLSQEKGLLQEWPKDGPKLLWKVANAGSGYSTPAIVDGRVYLLSNEGVENESVRALSVKDGKQIWATRLGKVGDPFQQPSLPAARSTATVEGELIYALGSDGDLACLESSGGKIRWQKNFARTLAASLENGLTRNRRWLMETRWSALPGEVIPRSLP